MLLSREERNQKKQCLKKFFLNKEEIYCLHPNLNCYAISNMGNIRNLLNWKLIKQTPNNSGYLYVNIFSDLENRRRTYSVHRLVMETFCNLDLNLKEILEVNHIDGNKNNNNLTNLEWVTRKENTNHSIQMRLSGKQKRSLTYKVTGQQIEDMLEFRKLGFKIREIAKVYGLSEEYTGLILRRKVRNENI